MKIAVYTISMNEEKQVAGWALSAKDADYLLVADTGSTDNTVKECEIHGVVCPQISIKPWRFDDARNAGLALIPADIDICIVLDMDERLSPGWRDEVEKGFAAGATKMRYKFVWSHTEDGGDGLAFFREGIHARHGYRWVHPVHEVAMADRIEEKMLVANTTVHHWPDSNKSRGQYIALLAQSVKERPDDDRNAHYYARELYFYDRMKEAAHEFRRHLALPTAQWKAERASSYRYLSKCEPEFAVEHLLMSLREEPRREVFVDLAKYFHDVKNWGKCRLYALQAIEIAERPLDYMCEEFAWGPAAYDYAAISNYWIGDSAAARSFGRMALDKDPGNKRLEDNLKFYSG